MQKLLLLILICPGLYSQDLDKILWGETQLSGPINFDFIKSEFEKNSTNNISGIFSINPYPKGLGVNLLKSEEIFETRNTNELFREFPEFMLNMGGDFFTFKSGQLYKVKQSLRRGEKWNNWKSYPTVFDILVIEQNVVNYTQNLSASADGINSVKIVSGSINNNYWSSLNVLFYTSGSPVYNKDEAKSFASPSSKPEFASFPSLVT